MTYLSFSEGLVAESELLSFLLGLVSVGMLARGDGRGWPIGTVMIVLSGWVFWKTGLHGSALLQLYYLPTQLYGWRRWSLHGKDDLRRTQRALQPWQRLGLLTAWVALTVAAAKLLTHTGGVSPTFDAFVTIGSLLGQTLIVASYFEAWPTFLAVNIVSVGLYFHSKLYFYAVMFLIFCGLAAQGWWKWTRESPEPKRIDSAL